jgi:hypothetical protein
MTQPRRRPCPPSCPGPNAHTKCGAHNRSGKPCGSHPLAGTQTAANPSGVCHLHGGRAPQVAAAAAARIAEAEALATVNQLTLRRDIDPASALLEEVQRAAGAVAYCESRIRDLDPDMIVSGVRWTRRVDDPDKGVVVSSEAGPGVSEWVRLWQSERDRLVVAARAALAADVDERQVRLAEAQGQLVADVIDRVLDGLDLSEGQRARVPEVVPAALRLVAG